MKKIIALSFCFLHAVFALAQFTTTTATITDSDSTVWTNAQVTVSFQPNPNQPNLNSYNINGTSLLSPTYNSYLQQVGTTNGSGVLSFTLLDNQLITPAGSSWHFVVKPNASVQAISYNSIAVTGGSFSLTSYLSTNSIAPRLPALPGSYAYADLEIQPIPNVGGFYFNTTATIQRIWNGTGWQNGAGGGGTIPATNNLLKGSGTTGIAVPATPGTDYTTPSGNIATATALANAPTQCNPGQSPQYIDAQGNVHNCQVVGAAGAIPATNNVLKGSGTAGSAVNAIPGVDFLFPNGDNGLNAHGIAATGANQNSYTFYLTSSYCTDGSPSCNPASVFYGQQIIAATGLQPLTLKNNNCVNTGAGTAACGEVFNYPIYTNNNVPIGDKTTAVANQLNIFNNLPGLPAQYFGAKGDAYQPPNGCSITASNNVVTCGDAPFVSTDIGKQIWISGAGAAGVAFNAVITSVTSTTSVIVNASASTTISSGRAIYGTDDVTAVQACFQYSASNGVSCVLRAIANPGLGLTGFLIGTGNLQFVRNNFLEENSGENVIGSGQISGTNLYCEYNGDCLNLGPGGIQGVNFVNITIQEDATQPNSRGIHLNPNLGSYGAAPFTNSNFINISVYNPAKECLFLDGGGGAGYGFNLPNQYLKFTQFWCSGPNQSHPANLILATGQDLQILFDLGQVNGQGWTGAGSSLYPNPLIKITEKTSTLGDSPVDWTFFDFTTEVGTQGLYIGNGTKTIHYDNSYVENIGMPFIVAGSHADTFNGNHIANSGNTTSVFQFSTTTGGSANNSTASVWNNLIYGGFTPAAIGICSTTDAISFANNTIESGVNILTNCLHTVATLPSASTVLPGTQIIITDCTSYTPGPICTGGGSDMMIAVSNGTAWTVH